MTEFSLMGNGSAGDWDVCLDEELKGDKKILEIAGLHQTQRFEIDNVQAISDLMAALQQVLDDLKE